MAGHQDVSACAHSIDLNPQRFFYNICTCWPYLHCGSIGAFSGEQQYQMLSHTDYTCDYAHLCVYANVQ